MRSGLYRLPVIGSLIKIQNLTVALLGGLPLQRDAIERKSTSGDNVSEQRQMRGGWQRSV